MLTARQLSARWGVSTGHLANLRAKGEGVEYIKIGAAVRYKLAAVESFESANTVEVAA